MQLEDCKIQRKEAIKNLLNWILSQPMTSENNRYHLLVENIDKLDIPATKLIQKIYHRHTGYMGHLKELTLKQVFERSPEKVLRLAVSRMLPKNFLRAKRMKRLTIKRSV